MYILIETSVHTENVPVVLDSLETLDEARAALTNMVNSFLKEEEDTDEPFCMSSSNDKFTYVYETGEVYELEIQENVIKS